ncbi:MAG: GNAT family N-acetyltransferase, partial [Eubacteriales bacterium]
MITYHVVDVQEVDKVAPFFSSAYRGWLHDPAMVVYCAKDDDLVVGAMGVLLGEQVAKILSLSVSPDYQRKGIGTGLVAQAQADLEFYECDSLQVNFSLDLENTWELAGLFDHAGFDVIEHSPVSRTCKVQDLLQSSITKKAAQYPREQIVPLESVPPVALQMYCNTFRLDLDLKALDGSLSMVAMNKGSVTGLLAIQKIGPQEIDAILLHVPF